jgi:hypothetical protein
MVHEDFIKENYNGYATYLAARKMVVSPFSVTEPKENHLSSLYAETKLTSVFMFGDASMSCEIKNSDVSDFKLALLSTIIPSKTLFRFDSKGPDHKNKVDYIPLSQQSVPTPHYHQFDEQGNLLAYQTPEMADETKKQEWHDVGAAFNFLCQSKNIHANQPDDKPRILVATGTIPFDYGDDPINGLNF